MGSQMSADSVPLPATVGMSLAGDGYPGVPSEATEGSIEANLLLLRDTRGGMVVLVAIDALFAGAALVNGLEAEFGGIRELRILVLASHSHYVPGLDGQKPALGPVDHRYVGSVVALIARSLRRLIGEKGWMTQTRLGVAHANHTVNRRRILNIAAVRGKVRLRSAVMAPNRKGPTDETLSLLLWRSNEGAPLAVLWNFACHPVSFPVPHTVSAHFPGRVRERIRAHLGSPDLPVLFSQGFSGDVRPGHAAVMRPTVTYPSRLLRGPGFSQFDGPSYEEWVNGLAEVAIAAIRDARDLVDDDLEIRSHPFRVRDFLIGSPEARGNISALRLGKVVVVGVPFEPVVEHGEWLRGVLEGCDVIPVGCTGNVLAYMPTRIMMERQGGYEVDGFCQRFGVTALAEHAPDHFRHAVSTCLGDWATGR